MRKSTHITVTDKFCGAGGSSQGADKSLKKKGINDGIALAMNHWKLAIETHNRNFPNTRHECTDISACDPRRYPSTTILITSPECTNHSLAKGQKQVKAQIDLFDKGKADASAERSRATMWDVCRFAEFHKYEIIIVENVVDARKWMLFDSWLHAMHALGYEHKCCYINSMHCHPTPQSRDRMYIVFWKKGNKAPNLNFTPRAYCEKCAQDINAVQVWKDPQKPYGKYRQQYTYRCPKDGTLVEPYYYAAFNCINWNDIGKRIGDRPKPLSPNTTKRIAYGLNKYGNDPYIIHAAYGDQARGVVRHITDPAFTHTTFKSQAIISPFIIKNEHAEQINMVRSVKESLQTQATRQSFSLVTPWIIEMNKTGECKPANNPTATLTAGGINHAMLTAPFIVENKGQSNARELHKPLGAVTTHDYHGIITNEAWNSFITAYYSKGHSINHFTDPIGTQHTHEGHAIVTYQKPQIEDCYYRMLKSPEIGRGMAFADTYEVCGSEKDKVKQYGNAVTPPSMEWLMDRCIESLE